MLEYKEIKKQKDDLEKLRNNILKGNIKLQKQDKIRLNLKQRRENSREFMQRNIRTYLLPFLPSSRYYQKLNKMFFNPKLLEQSDFEFEKTRTQKVFKVILKNINKIVKI